MAAVASVTEMASVNAEFDIFAPKLVQVSVQEIVETTYKPIAKIDHSDLEFNIPAEADFYVDPNIHIFVSGQLVSAVGKAQDSTDHKSVSNNLLPSLFSQCSVTEWHAHNTKHPRLWLPGHVGNTA
jgi:hypothetical protein